MEPNLLAHGALQLQLTAKKTGPFQYRKRMNGCSNYDPIRSLSHTMKIFEDIIGSFGHRSNLYEPNRVKNCEATDVIHTARLLIEKYRENDRSLYIAFLGLEEAFNCVPHKFIWCSLQLLVPEELVG